MGTAVMLKKTTLELLDVVRSVARPKAIYRVSRIQNKDEDSVIIDGVKFPSILLRTNLDKVERVFPMWLPAVKRWTKSVFSTVMHSLAIVSI